MFDAWVDVYYDRGNLESLVAHSRQSSQLAFTVCFSRWLMPGSDLEPKDWAFVRDWSNRLGVSLEVLLHRILVAAVIGQLYVEKIPKI